MNAGTQVMYIKFSLLIRIIFEPIFRIFITGCSPIILTIKEAELNTIHKITFRFTLVCNNELQFIITSSPYKKRLQYFTYLMS